MRNSRGASASSKTRSPPKAARPPRLRSKRWKRCGRRRRSWSSADIFLPRLLRGRWRAVAQRRRDGGAPLHRFAVPLPRKRGRKERSLIRWLYLLFVEAGFEAFHLRRIDGKRQFDAVAGLAPLQYAGMAIGPGEAFAVRCWQAQPHHVFVLPEAIGKALKQQVEPLTRQRRNGGQRPHLAAREKPFANIVL